MFFQKVTIETYDQLCSALLLRLTFQDWPELTCQEFAQSDDFFNNQGGTLFLDLPPLDTVKSLFSALLKFILSK